jgi:hypothetical protein
MPLKKSAVWTAIGSFIVLSNLSAGAQPSQRTTAAGAQIPSEFLGVYISAGATNNQCRRGDWKGQAQGEEPRLMRIAPRSIEYWESSCNYLGVKAQQAADEGAGRSRVSMTCAGEGETWRTTELWQVKTVDGRKILIMAELERDERNGPRRLKYKEPPLSLFLECN